MKIVIDVDTDNPIHHAEGTDYFMPDLHTYISENMLEILKKKGKVLPTARCIDINEIDEWYCATFKCSNCGDVFPGRRKYCWSCGAKMEVEDGKEK